MAISRFQMNRQLRAYGGIMGQDGRRNYGIGSFFQKKIMDPIKNIGKKALPIAATLGGSYLLGKTGGEDFASKETGLKGIFENILGGARRVGSGVGKVLSTPVGSKDEKDKQSTIGSTLLSGILSPQGLAIGSGLLAGAFTKDKDNRS